MVRTIKLQTNVPENRELRIALTPDFPTGPAEVHVVEPVSRPDPVKLFAVFLDSEFVGMWRERADTSDSAEFAHGLRSRGYGPRGPRSKQRILS